METSLEPGHAIGPPPVAVAARSVPSDWEGGASGDWHDVIALPSGDVAVVVGDAAGHGVQARPAGDDDAVELCPADFGRRRSPRCPERRTTSPRFGSTSRDIGAGLAGLAALADRFAGASLDELCARLLSLGLEGSDPTDDLTVIALRLQYEPSDLLWVLRGEYAP
jgi:hypothetical protein